MATISDLDRVAAIVLRSMRGPILVLLVVYAIGIVGMALMPGQDAEGNPERMSLFHAFYFLTYTATTTGFGEIPTAFSGPQRLWAMICLYAGVIAWLYTIGAIFKLTQNPHFLRALAERQFARGVRHLSRPFFIICGFGDTGSLLTRGLNDEGLSAVIIDSDPERIKALGLRDYRFKMPGLCADASVPKHLLDAGLRHPLCRGVVALTSNEHINLKIAVMSRYLNPQARIICRSTSARHKEELVTLETVNVVDPFESFAHQLSIALYFPQLHALGDWLVRAREATLEKPPRPPLGTWIICGYGRMGRQLHESFLLHKVPTVVIEPRAEAVTDLEHKVIGHTTEKNLREAGIEQAVGIVAGTNSDTDNLRMLLKARALNPDIFVVVRQNGHENQVVFNAAHANLIMQPSLVTARRMLLMSVAPMILPLLGHLRRHPDALDELVQRLEEALRDEVPELWTTEIADSSAMAVMQRITVGKSIVLADIYRDPAQPTQHLACVPLVLSSGQDLYLVPKRSHSLQPGDQVLFCGTRQAQRLLDATLNNPYTLSYILTGNEKPRSYLFKWFSREFFQRKTTGS